MCHSNGLHLLLFTCKRDPSQGRSGSWMLLPFVLFKDCHIRISAYYCLFLQGVSQHFGCLLMVDFQPCPIWTLTWEIRSVLEVPLHFLLSLKFSEGLLVLESPLNLLCIRSLRRGFQSGQGLFTGFSLPGNFFTSCWGFLFVQSSRRSSLLSPGCCFPPLSSHRFLWALAFPKIFIGLLGLQNPRRDCSAPAIDVLGRIIPAFLSLHSAKNKVSWYPFPAL